MGKADKWFRGLLGFRKPDTASPQPPPSRSASKPQKQSRRWSCVKSYREKDDIYQQHHTLLHQNAAKLGRSKTRAPSGGADSSQQAHFSDDEDPNNRAMASAEAAVAAAQAVVAVLSQTRSRRSGNVNSAPAEYGGVGSGLLRRERWAAVKIQSAFRGYLAKKALRALKALVKLQALVRGHIERKRLFRRMQALLQAQARAISGSAYFIPNGPTAHRMIPSSHEAHFISSLRLYRKPEDVQFYTAENSPRLSSSASTRGGSSRRSPSPLALSKSDGSRSHHLSGYSNHHPNYMSYTESYKAKARSLSAPKQRLHFDRSGSSKRNSIHGFPDSFNLAHAN